MIFERIHAGETAEQIGIEPHEYAQRAALLQRFLAQWDGSGDLRPAYLEWLNGQKEGAQSKPDSYLAPQEWTPQQPARGLGDTVAKMTNALGIKPCGGCKKRQAALNKAFPYGGVK